MSNAPRCPTCRRPVSLRADRCPMCGEDLESYRATQTKLLLLGLAVVIFLIPAFVVNRVSGRFENYITDTFFDWPSYLIALVCWCGLFTGIYFLRRAFFTPSAKENIPGEHKKGPRMSLLHLGLVFVSCVILLAHGLEYLKGRESGGDDPEPEDHVSEQVPSPDEGADGPIAERVPQGVGTNQPSGQPNPLASTADSSKPPLSSERTGHETESTLAAPTPEPGRSAEQAPDPGKAPQIESKMTALESTSAAADLKLAESGADLAALESRIASERTRWSEALGTINRLTNFKKAPVKEGSAAYHQCMEASRVIQEVERKAPDMKAEKARLETLIEELRKNQL